MIHAFVVAVWFALSSLTAADKNATSPMSSPAERRMGSLSDEVERFAEPFREHGLTFRDNPGWRELSNRYRDQESVFIRTLGEFKRRYRGKPDSLFLRYMLTTILTDDTNSGARVPALMAYNDHLRAMAASPESYKSVRTAHREFAQYLASRILTNDPGGDYALWIEGYQHYLSQWRKKESLPYADIVEVVKHEVPRSMAHLLEDSPEWPDLRLISGRVWGAISRFLKHETLAMCYDGDRPDIPKALIVRAVAGAESGDHEDARRCLDRTKHAKLSPEWEGIRLAVKLQVLAAEEGKTKALELARHVIRSQPVASCAFRQALDFLGKRESVADVAELLAEGHYRALLTGPTPTHLATEFAGRAVRHKAFLGSAPWLIRLLLAEMAAQRSEEGVGKCLQVLITLAGQTGLDHHTQLALLTYLVAGPAGPDGRHGTLDDLRDVWQGPLANHGPPPRLIEMARASAIKSESGGSVMRRVAAAFHQGRHQEATELLQAGLHRSPDPARDVLASVERSVEAFKTGHLGYQIPKQPEAKSGTTKRSTTSKPSSTTAELCGRSHCPVARVCLLRHLLKTGSELGTEAVLGLARTLILEGSDANQNLELVWNALARLRPDEALEQRSRRLCELLDERSDAGLRRRTGLWVASRLLQSNCCEAADKYARWVEGESEESQPSVGARVIRIMVAGAKGELEQGLDLVKSASKWSLRPPARARLDVVAGWLCLQSGDIPEARRYLASAAALDPPNADSRRAREILARLNVQSPPSEGMGR